MTFQVEAILFDMGGTLRRNSKRDEASKSEIVQQILDLLGSGGSAKEFSSLLTLREKAYDEWATKNLTELGEIDLWTKWMLPDWPIEIISMLAMELNWIWRNAICTRMVFPETPSTIMGLHQGGYRLGLVSNTTSSVDSPLTLEKAGIIDCFETIILSCVVGKRKPGPEIMLEAVRKMGVLPEKCAYVGDRPDWDVCSARMAGIGRTIILRNPYKPITDQIPPEQEPDQYIDNLKELLDLFPALNP